MPPSQRRSARRRRRWAKPPRPPRPRRPSRSSRAISRRSPRRDVLRVSRARGRAGLPGRTRSTCPLRRRARRPRRRPPPRERRTTNPSPSPRRRRGTRSIGGSGTAARRRRRGDGVGAWRRRDFVFVFAVAGPVRGAFPRANVGVPRRSGVSGREIVTSGSYSAIHEPFLGTSESASARRSRDHQEGHLHRRNECNVRDFFHLRR